MLMVRLGEPGDSGRWECVWPVAALGLRGPQQPAGRGGQRRWGYGGRSSPPEGPARPSPAGSDSIERPAGYWGGDGADSAGAG